MSQVTQYDVAVVGLGPVGAVAANLCGQAGFNTVVIERGAEPYTLPRAIHLDAEVMRIFQSVGLDRDIAPMTRPLGGSVYLGCDGRPIRSFRSQDTRTALGWPASNLFYQPKLEAALRCGLSRFENVTVQLSSEVRDITQSATGVVLDGDTTIRAKYVLACDGASSPVRKALGIALDNIAFEERWLVIDAMMNGPMRWPARYDIPEDVRSGLCSLMVCDPARPATIIPGSGRHRRWEYMLLPGESDEAAQDPDNIARLLSSWVDPKDVEVVRSAVYRFRGLIAKQWRAGNVFLMGDAAHQTPPFFGQGMCHGIRDAAQLIWKLRLVMDGRADEALLDSYQEEREVHVRSVITASIAAGAAVCILDPAKAAERDVRFRAEEAARGGVTVAMTDIVPPITSGIIDRNGGARLPQPPVQVSGADARLDDLLAGRFTLLSFDDAPALGTKTAFWLALDGQWLRLSADASGVQDTTGQLARWMHERGARWVLVRPDRYVFGTAADSAGLEELLSRLEIKLCWQERADARAIRPPKARTS